MDAEKNILLTGITGNLGAELLKLLLLDDKQKKTKFFLLVREKDKKSAEERIFTLFKFLFKSNYRKFLNSNIEILAGDVTKIALGLGKHDYDALVRQVDVIYHVAALTRFQDALLKQRLTNVVGTKRILELMAQAHKAIELHYVGTIFVAGTFNGEFSEKDFNVNQNFNNPYEKSKFEAEKIVRAYAKKGGKICLYRPSILVGEYLTGAILNFQMFYKALYLISRGVIKEIPVNKKTLVPLIPTDVAAQMIFTLSKNCSFTPNNIVVYHITMPHSLNISAINDVISEYFHIKGAEFLIGSKMTSNAPTKSSLYTHFLQMMTSYLRFDVKIVCKDTLSRLKALKYQPPTIDQQYIKRLLAYAVKSGYIKQ